MELKDKRTVALDEQETAINWLREDERAIICTTDKTMMTKLLKLVNAEGSEWRIEKDNDFALTVSCPKKLISLRTKTTKRELSDEQREEFVNRMQKSLNKS